MSRFQTAKGTTSQTHSPGSSALMSVSGQVTPLSELASDPAIFDREDRGPSHHHRPPHRPPPPFVSPEPGSHAGRSISGDDEDGSEMYELSELSGDDDYSEEDEEEEDEEDEDDAHGVAGRARKPVNRRRLSESTVASFQLYTPDEERAVVRKFDRRLVMFLAFCYMLSFVDRSSALPPFSLSHYIV